MLIGLHGWQALKSASRSQHLCCQCKVIKKLPGAERLLSCFIGPTSKHQTKHTIGPTASKPQSKKYQFDIDSSAWPSSNLSVDFCRIHSWIPLFVRSLARSLTQSVIHSFIHSFTDSFGQPEFILQSFNPFFTNWAFLARSFICAFNLSFSQ